MTDFSSVVDESITISDSAVSAHNAGRVGVAGSTPLGYYNKRSNVLLLEAVKSKWQQTTGVNPALGSVHFLPTWFSDSADTELIFNLNDRDMPVSQRSIGWRYHTVQDFVDIHVFVRGAGGDTEPANLASVENALQEIFRIYGKELVENAICTIIRIIPGRGEDGASEGINETLWHSVFTVLVRYWTVLIV
jgi:hypothetical protein